MSRALVWYRNDLRVKDNAVLSKAINRHDQVFTVYCFDPRHFTTNKIGIPSTGSFRAQFLLETLEELQKSLVLRGGNLMIRIGRPEEVLPQLVKEFSIDEVYAEKSALPEEIHIEESLEKELWGMKVLIEFIWHSTLYHVNDIPWPIKHLPEVFTDFRKELEQTSSIREQVELPKSTRRKLAYGSGFELPTLKMLGLEEPIDDSRGVIKFRGGESEAWRRLNQYFWEGNHLGKYKETRNGLVGADYSSKFSPWLANGSISPKSIHGEIKQYEKERVSNDSTYWLYFELLWRDFFKFVSKKHGQSIYELTGIRNKSITYSDNPELFEKWKNGETGELFVDANMIELKNTGFMSNRGRQIVASYLVNDLGVNWTWGALYFQSMLIDYDPASNWGNWNYIAGVGNDPRPDRYFNIQSQAERYDPDGRFVNLWLEPSLK